MRVPPTNPHLAAVVLATFAICAPPALAQAPTPLGRPDAVVAEPFSLIRGARELPDGRLLVTDWIEQRIALVDLTKGTVVDRGRVGAGPGEFRLPSRLLAYGTDSTVLIDVGNARLAVLDAEGRIARTFQPTTSAALSPVAIDVRGRLWFAIPQWEAAAPLAGDTVEVATLEAGAARATAVARVHGPTRPSSQRSMGPRLPMVVFATQDAWAVSPAGRLAIVRGGDYSVEVRTGARTVRGPANPYPPIAASAAERKAYVRRFLASSPTSGRGADGGMGHTPAEAQSDAGVAEVMRNTEFAETLPPFRAGDARFDASERLWVGRSVRTGEPLRYDVFDAAGGMVGAVALPPDRELLTLGARSVYLVHTDADGLQTIERYPLPPIGPRR